MSRYDIFTTPKHEFQGVEDDVNALEWLPNSAHEMMAATQDKLFVCDTRQVWTTKLLQ